MYDIIVMGSAVIDIFAKTEAETIRIKGSSHGTTVDEELLAYPLGSKILIKELEFNIGGGGTNVCATFSKMGLKTALITKIGKDNGGKEIFEWLAKEGITYLGAVGGQTGYSIILDSQAEDRTILTYKGANDEINYEELPKHEFNTRWFYSSSMNGISFKTQEKLFTVFKNRGAKTAYNPSSYITERGIGFVKKILEKTDLLILNKEEAEMLAGKGEYREIAERLRAHGPKIIAITDGSKGAHISNETKGFYTRPTPGIEVVETTGAGDAFASGMVSGLALKTSLEESALLGILVAEEVIKNYGAKNGIPDINEARKKIKKYSIVKDYG